MNARLLLLVSAIAMFTTGCIRSPVAMMASTKPLSQGGYTEIGQFWSRLSRTVRRVYKHIFASRGCQDAIPKSSIRQKCWPYARTIDKRCGAKPEHFFGTRVVGRGKGRLLCDRK